MIRHKIFSKGERIHALIHSTTNPNILFPVRGMIYDTKFDEYNPQYQIKVDKMYDDIAFLKRYLLKAELSETLMVKIVDGNLQEQVIKQPMSLYKKFLMVIIGKAT